MTPSSMPSGPPVVIAINDEPVQLELMAGFLRQQGFDMRPFLGAQPALEAINSGLRPDLVITDLYMPAIDGWQLCRLLRSPEFAALNRTPILVVSATFSGDYSDRIARDLGANAFLSAPYDPQRLLSVSRQLLRGESPQYSPTLLVVEDDPLQRELIELSFRVRGYEVTGAGDGAEALALFNRLRPDTVILDHYLPGVLGSELLREFKQTHPSAVVVVITGDANPGLAVEFMSLGAAAYVRKPFSAEYLGAVCERARRERSLLNVETLLEQRSRQLQASERRFRSLVERSSELFGMLDANGRFAYLSPGVGPLLGYTEGELLGREAMSLVHPDDAPDVGRRLELLLGEPNRTALSEFRCRHKNGSWVLMEGSGVNLLDDAAIQGVVFNARSVGTQRRLEAELRQAQKLQAVGRLAAGLAHDLNNILTVIQGHTGLLLKDPGVAGSMREALSEVEASGNRAGALVQQLLAFTRQQVLQAQSLDLNRAVGNACGMLRQLIGNRAKLEWRLADDVPPVVADAGRLDQVLMNLVLNARDAMPTGGTITLVTRRLNVDAAGASRHAEAEPGLYAVLEVSDTGCGMDSEVQERMFEPFFTTKEVGQGAGLGLSTVYGIVKQHGGWVEAHSRVGEGSTFSVILPADPGTEPPPEGLPAPAPTGSAEGRETLLLVEDDKAVRAMAAASLESHGYRVLQAGNGAQATRIWSEERDRIDLLCTDLVLPEGVTGLDLARRFAAEKGGLRILFTSGYAVRLGGGGSDLLSEAAFLPKPYNGDALARRVRECLDRPADSGGG